MFRRCLILTVALTVTAVTVSAEGDHPRLVRHDGPGGTQHGVPLDAGKALGLTPWQRLVHVRVPAMVRITLPALSNTFISLFKDTSVASVIAVPELTTAALNQLRNYDWPGNLPQLSNVVRTLCVTSLASEIDAADVVRVIAPMKQANSPAIAQSIPLDVPLREARDAFERLYFEHLIQQEGGSMTRVADKSGLERTHLYRKLKQLNIRHGRRLDEAL